MKLKHPTVLSLTSICRNLRRQKAKRRMETKKKGTRWSKKSWGRSFVILVDRRDARMRRDEGEVKEEDLKIS